jgi:inner membrane protein
MDNLCHTLTGAALAQAGLASRTRFASSALVIAANLPDIDVLAFVTDTPAVALRRGWTHGVLAQALLPIILTALFVLLDKWRPPRSADARRFRPLALLALCYAGVLSHVGMDWLNTYGVRLLMPFSRQWFYGDAVFIVDPWLWLVFASGLVLSRRRRSGAPARGVITLAMVYILLMVVSASAARTRVAEAWTLANGRAPHALMVGPAPVTPFRKTIIVDGGGYYQRGTFTWLPPRIAFDPAHVPKGSDLPAVREVQTSPQFRGLLVWARFPFYEVTPAPGGVRVTLADMRFGVRLFQATVFVPVH